MAAWGFTQHSNLIRPLGELCEGARGSWSQASTMVAMAVTGDASRGPCTVSTIPRWPPSSHAQTYEAVAAMHISVKKAFMTLWHVKIPGVSLGALLTLWSLA